MYYLDNQMYYTETEDKAMHVIIDDDHLLLYHDLCNGGNDILWFTLIKDYSNLNHSVYDSWFYTLPTQKTMALDLIYDEKNDRFNFLSNLNYCSLTPYLAQGEPFYLYNGLKIGQLDGGMATTTCTTSTSPSKGRIHYAFYDMVGKLIRQGETSNGITNKLPDLHGLYLLEVKDEVGNRTVNKTF